MNYPVTTQESGQYYSFIASDPFVEQCKGFMDNVTARKKQQQRLANLISHFLFVHLKSPDTLRLNINSSYIQKQLNVAIESLPDGLMACSGM